MENAIHRLTLDVQRPVSCKRIDVKRGDSARTLLVMLSDKGRPYKIGDDCTVVFSARKPDGVPIFNNCTVEGNVVRYDFTGQTTNVAGLVGCEIRVYGPDALLLTSAGFEMLVHDTVYQDGDIPDSSPEYTALTEMVSKGTALISGYEDALARIAEIEEAVRTAAEEAQSSAASASEDASVALGAKEAAQTAQEAAEGSAEDAKGSAEAAAGSADASGKSAGAAAAAQAAAESSAGSAAGAVQEAANQAAAAKEFAEAAEAAAERAEAAGGGNQSAVAETKNLVLQPQDDGNTVDRIIVSMGESEKDADGTDKNQVMELYGYDGNNAVVVRNVADPVATKDAANKGYVDTVVSGLGGGGTGGAVASVNGKTGAVVLGAGDVGADPAGTAEQANAAHNTAAGAHQDIRQLIEGLTTRLNTALNSEDVDLDQLAELVAYIKANRELIGQVTTNKVSVSDIVDDLETNLAGKVLSAAQGVALKALIDGVSGELNDQTGQLKELIDQAKGTCKSDLTAHDSSDQAHPAIRALIQNVADDLANYYRRTETYSREEVDQRLSAIPKFSILPVDALPDIAEASATTVYLLRSGDEDSNLYTEYIAVGGSWESLGTQTVDLAGYAKETWVSEQLAGYQPKGDFALRSELPASPGDVGADPAGTASSAVTAHAQDGTAHQDIREAVAALQAGPVPAYVAQEAEATANKVLAVRGADCFVFGAVSDLHTSGDDTSAAGILHAGQAMDIIHSLTRLDLVANFGDIAVGYFTDGGESAYTYVNKCFADVRRSAPCIRMQANHDLHPTDPKEVAQLRGYAYIGANNAGVVTDPDNRFRNYGYMDFDDLRMRVIYLNTSDVCDDEVTGDCYITAAQLSWFVGTALDFSDKTDPGAWEFIVCSHHPLNWDTSTGHLLTILDAYKGGQSGSISVDGSEIAYDFTSAVAGFIAHFHGHIHNFRAETLGTYGVPTITIPNACYDRNNEYGTYSSYSEDIRTKFGDTDADGNQRQYNKTAGTAEDTAFNVIVVDRAEQVIHCFNYGAGIDRAVSYGAAVVYTITNSLTNVATSNAAASATAGSAYSATLSAADGYTLEGGTVAITMGGVDVTETAYTGGVISINQITGDIIITATAVAAAVGPAYTNLVPSSIAADGSVYNGGLGYKQDFRLNSSGSETAQSGTVVCGFIPVSSGDVVRASGSASAKVSGNNHAGFYINGYNAAFQYLESLAPTDAAGNDGIWDNSGELVLWTVDTALFGTMPAYVRVSMPQCSVEDFVVTVNEEITD